MNHHRSLHGKCQKLQASHQTASNPRSQSKWGEMWCSPYGIAGIRLLFAPLEIWLRLWHMLISMLSGFYLFLHLLPFPLGFSFTLVALYLLVVRMWISKSYSHCSVHTATTLPKQWRILQIWSRHKYLTGRHYCKTCADTGLGICSLEWHPVQLYS